MAREPHANNSPGWKAGDRMATRVFCQSIPGLPARAFKEFCTISVCAWAINRKKSVQLNLFCFGCGGYAARPLHHLNLATNPAFAVDHLSAFFGPHAGAEADFTSAFDVAGFVGVMHEKFPLKRTRRSTDFCKTAVLSLSV
jgi:hypothetical protein